jgi:hypothetical protein
MRIAAPASTVRPIAFLPRARVVGHGWEEGATVPAAANLAVTPVHAASGFIAQTIAQELMDGEPRPGPACLAAYMPEPPASFEGLNFRALA